VIIRSGAREDFGAIRVFVWLLIAIVVGVGVAVLPNTIAGLLIGGTILIVASLITPLAPLIMLLIIAPIRTLFATESTFSLPLDFGQLFLVVTLGCWIISRVTFQQKLPRFKFSAALIAVIGFITATALSAFSAFSLSAWLPEWLKWLQIALLIVVCADLASHRKWEWMVFGMVAAAFTNALIGIHEFFGGSGALHLLVNDQYFRAFGTFGQPNPFGGFMGLIAPIAAAAALGYAIKAWNLWRNAHKASLRSLLITLFYIAAFGTISTALLMSWSRGAWLGFGASMLIILVAAPRRLWRGIILLGLISLIGAILWFSERLPTSVTERIASATQETFSFSDVRGVDITSENYALVERLAHWQAAINMATDHPFWGVGLGNYEMAYPSYRLLNWDLALGHAHNYYLNVLGETGIIGLVSYVALWLTVSLLTWRTIRRHPDPLSRLIAVGLLGTWTYLALHSLTDNLYVNNLFIHLGILLGILTVLSDQVSATVLRMRVAWGS
jgi:O-antigen ligase